MSNKTRITEATSASNTIVSKLKPWQTPAAGQLDHTIHEARPRELPSVFTDNAAAGLL